MQPTMFLTLASIAWITCAMSVPDSEISSSFAKNDKELLVVSRLTTGLASLSGFLTKGYYNDQNCNTLIHMEGVKLGVCRYSSSDYGYTITTVDQNQIRETQHTKKDCTDEGSAKTVVAYTDGACTADLTVYRVSATRNVPTPGYMIRSMNKICSPSMQTF
jgi:hypothetical protein